MNSILDKHIEKAKNLCEEIGIDLPKTYYRYGFVKCWKCEKEIIVFAWPKDSLHSDDAPRVKPIPKTIVARFSNSIDDNYWVNSCPHCNNIQGDFFMYMEPDALFLD